MVAVITGGSRGIGAAIAKELVSQGMRVAILYKSSEKQANELISELNSDGFNAISICADVRDINALEAARDTIHSVFGNVDIVVNNAGIAHIAPLYDLTPSMWREVMGVNLDGAFYTTKTFLHDLIDSERGSIINVSSVWGVYGGSCESAYSASKAGLIGFSKALARELGNMNITVNCIAPGVIDTDMNSMLSEEDMSVLKSSTPLARTGSAEEVAKLVAFLAGEGARFITGEVISVGGGFIG